MKQKEKEAKAQDIYLFKFFEIFPLFEDIQSVVAEQFLKQMNEHGFHDHLLAKRPTDNPDFKITGFFTRLSNPQVNLLKSTDFERVINGLPNRTITLVLV